MNKPLFDNKNMKLITGIPVNQRTFLSIAESSKNVTQCSKVDMCTTAPVHPVTVFFEG